MIRVARAAASGECWASLIWPPFALLNGGVLKSSDGRRRACRGPAWQGGDSSPQTCVSVNRAFSCGFISW
eukprot:scaffold312268_cov35-Tisochrysis_lutea.AAC.1